MDNYNSSFRQYKYNQENPLLQKLYGKPIQGSHETVKQNSLTFFSGRVENNMINKNPFFPNTQDLNLWETAIAISIQAFFNS